jgi:acetylglutamate kinase
MKIEKIEKKRGRGRPPFTIGQPKKSVVHLRVTAQEKADWVRSALPSTLSAWITQTLRGASEKQPPA